MRNPSAIYAPVFILAVVFVWCVWMSYQQTPSEPVVYCVDSQGKILGNMYMSRQECHDLREESLQVYIDKGVAAKKIGCVFTDSLVDDGLNCPGNKQYEFMRGPDNVGFYRETEDSRICTPYYDRPVSTLPVRCLRYFNIPVTASK